MAVKRDMVVAPKLTVMAAPAISEAGTPGATTWTYKVVAVDIAGGTTEASSAGTTTSGAATLNATNYNVVDWAAVTGAVSYKVYRTAAGGTPSTTGLIATVDAPTSIYNDQGAAGDGSAAPSTNTSGVGAALECFDMERKTIQVSGTFVGTFQPQGSIDNVNWVDIGATITAPLLREVSHTVAFMRLVSTAYTSGTPAAVMAGDINN